MTPEEKKAEENRLPIREYLDLRLKAFRSEMRLLIFASIAGNQLLSHLSLVPAKGAAAALVAGVIAFIGGRS